MEIILAKQVQLKTVKLAQLEEHYQIYDLEEVSMQVLMNLKMH